MAGLEVTKELISETRKLPSFEVSLPVVASYLCDLKT